MLTRLNPCRKRLQGRPRGWALQLATLALGLGLSLCLSGTALAEGDQSDEAVILQPRVKGTPLAREEQARLELAVSRALEEAQLRPVPGDNRDAILAGEPELQECFSAECQDRIGRLLSAKAVLTQEWEVKRDGPVPQAPEPPPAGVKTQAPPKGKKGPGLPAPFTPDPNNKGWWRFTVSMFNVTIGAVGVKESIECNKADLEAAGRCLSDLVKKVVLLESQLGRASIEVNSTPAADVSVDGRKLGFTPYKRQAYAGKHEVAVSRTGYRTVHATVVVEEGKKTPPVTVTLTQGSDTEFREERSPRPKWRLIAGASAIGAGILMLSFGASALSVNGQCVTDSPMMAGMCATEMMDGKVVERRFNTTGMGAGLVTVGALLAVGGGVLIALPGEKRMVQVTAAPLSFGNPSLGLLAVGTF